MKIINVEQRSAAWHELRRKSIGASDLPVLMRTVSWKTPKKLAAEKAGIAPDQDITWAMQRGIDAEVVVLEHYPEYTPMVVQHDDFEWAIASLDGYSEFDQRIIEIKAPHAANHGLAVDGMCPPSYVPQVQWQLAITGLKECLYLSYFEGEIAEVVVTEDKIYQDVLFQVAKDFYDRYVKEKAF